jgi:hypothetical protein
LAAIPQEQIRDVESALDLAGVPHWRVGWVERSDQGAVTLA